ncbi:hypothetical protein HYV57_02170 [Candidatus Peregrinibacteria bacterium]|nr:hypothetical protein [Candidatus Peregrinibacteria bacterium]
MLKQQFVTDEKGKKLAVVLSIGQFDELHEDLHDLRIIAERKKEKTIICSELMKKMK